MTYYITTINKKAHIHDGSVPFHAEPNYNARKLIIQLLNSLNKASSFLMTGWYEQLLEHLKNTFSHA